MTDTSTIPDKSGTLTVITTHINADYDAIGSMLAAQKLYPGSVVVFPGSHEKSLRHFFISSLIYLFNIADIKTIDIESIERLVLVDTRQKNRIGALSEYIDTEGCDIHIYDHHPASDNDIKGTIEVILPTGSTTTILTNILKEKNISISSEEATIMCLGIYEDTGSFTFSSTTESDFHAAGFLLSNGANLDIVSNFLSKEIGPRQVSCLNDMIRSATTHRINDVDVTMTIISSEDYISDFSALVHKMVQMENLSVVVAIGRMGNKIYLVVRSKLPEVDAAVITAAFGGGGHSYAASAAIKDKTLAQTEQKLFEVLHQHIQSSRIARDLMSTPPITISTGVTCREAAKLLTRYNINSLVVIESEPSDDSTGIAGFITRQVIEKALYHELEETPVKEFMTSEIITAGLETDIDDIQEIIIGNKQRIVPIVENNVIKGVITRTDLLTILVQRSQLNTGKFPDPLEKPLYARTKNIIKFIEERLSEHLIEILKKIGTVASDLGYGVYVVGGFVRDLMLYRDNDDVDIVIEGDGINFARKFAHMEDARVNTYDKFGTAVIIFPDGFKIDVATARMEYYRSPAALPEVEMSSIKLDLYRRDFTINTLAIRLDPEHFGTLIDFFSAQRDLKDKAIRIIHNLSFVEDPTRVFRAIKFEQRFGFTIGKLTSGLIKNAVKMDFFKRLGGLRVFSELKQILEEENPIPAIIRLFDYELMKVIHEEIKRDNGLIKALDSAKKSIAWHDLLYTDEPCEKWIVYFVILIRKYPRKVSEEISKRLMFNPKQYKLFNTERFKAEGCLFWLDHHLPASNSALYRHLSPFRTELILFMMAVSGSEEVKKAISHYYTNLRNIEIYSKGRDLKQLGVKPGPVYREVLESVLDAKLNGIVKTKEDELNFIKQLV